MRVIALTDSETGQRAPPTHVPSSGNEWVESSEGARGKM